MSVFKVGDRVEGVDEAIKGVVRSVVADMVTIESEDGFLLQFPERELMAVPKYDKLRVTDYEVAKVKSEKRADRPKKVIAVKPKERNAPKMEVDLHIDQLVKSSKGMTNHEMVDLQLETAKRQLDFAIRKRIQKVVFIHGVGEGVLREELHYLFRRYQNLKYYDAEYRKYGTGATEVYIYQNS
ncbi:Smr/MutS family protein [Maribacter algicola]|uniref:Smr/MutS family protein n=1 Tax=Meishania litoralis TaxID=3434685 RepID=A0ACC7LQI0_9FLAO